MNVEGSVATDCEALIDECVSKAQQNKTSCVFGFFNQKSFLCGGDFCLKLHTKRVNRQKSAYTAKKKRAWRHMQLLLNYFVNLEDGASHFGCQP